jgi:hypothetical protein
VGHAHDLSVSAAFHRVSVVGCGEPVDAAPDTAEPHTAVSVSAVGFKKTTLLREGLINSLLSSRLI